MVPNCGHGRPCRPCWPGALRQSGVGRTGAVTGERHLRVGKCWCGTRRAAAVWLGAPSAIEWSSSSSSSSTYLGILRTVLLKLERRAAAA